MSMPRSGMWPQRQPWLQVFMTRGTITPHNVHCVTFRPKLPNFYSQSIPSNPGWCLALTATTTTTTHTALNCRSDDKSHLPFLLPTSNGEQSFPLPTSYSQWQQQVELNPKETQIQLDLFVQSVSKTKHGSPLTTLQTQCSLGKEQCPDAIHKAVNILSQHRWDQNPNTIYFEFDFDLFLLLKLTCNCSISPMMTWNHITINISSVFAASSEHCRSVLENHTEHVCIPIEFHRKASWRTPESAPQKTPERSMTPIAQ